MKSFAARFRRGVAERIEKRDSRQNGYKTICTSAVLSAFGITNYRYSQYVDDVVRLLRDNGWSVRSRKSQVGNCTIGQLRLKLAQGKVDNRGVLLVQVDRHVLLMDGNGRTVVDTDPRKRDRRKVLKIYSVARQH